MKLLNAQLSINIKLDTKEELLTTVNTLLIHNITSYLISEDISTIGSLRVTGEVTKSSISNGYVITIYSKDLETVDVIKQLLNE